MVDPSLATLGGYVLVELIGRGGMGEVWRAERTGAGGVRRRAAVKRILPQFQRDPVLRERFLAEARITSRLEHPNIVQVLHFDDQPEPYLVLEYVDGVSVADLLRRGSQGESKFPLAATLYLIAEAAEGLDYAHRRTDEDQRPLGIVHRDVSPPNILVSLDGAVKVNDFGVARAADNIVRTQAGLSVGKLVYMAPEQAIGGAVDRRADVFSLGVVLWEMLTMRPLLPRDATSAAMLENLRNLQVTPPSTIAKGIPPEVDTIVREALQHDPTARTASAGRMSKSLRMALHSLAPGFDRRDLANAVRDALPELAVRASSERGTYGGSARDRKFDNEPARDGSPAPVASVPKTPVAGTPLREVSADAPYPKTQIAGSPSPAMQSLNRADATTANARPIRDPPPSSDAANVAAPSSPPTIAGAPPSPGGLAGPAEATWPAPSPFAPRDVARSVEPSAPRATPTRSRAWIVAVALVVIASAASAYWYFDPGGLLRDESASVDPSRTDPAAQSMRNTLTSMLPVYLGACGVPVSTARQQGLRADVSFQPSGELQSARVIVNQGATPSDQAVAACVQRFVAAMRAPATARGIVVEGVSVGF